MTTFIYKPFFLQSSALLEWSAMHTVVVEYFPNDILWKGPLAFFSSEMTPYSLWPCRQLHFAHWMIFVGQPLRSKIMMVLDFLCLYMICLTGDQCEYKRFIEVLVTFSRLVSINNWFAELLRNHLYLSHCRHHVLKTRLKDTHSHQIVRWK